jgi:hypothetical protein
MLTLSTRDRAPKLWRANDPGVQLRTHRDEFNLLMVLGAFVCCNGVLASMNTERPIGRDFPTMNSLVVGS